MNTTSRPLTLISTTYLALTLVFISCGKSNSYVPEQDYMALDKISHVTDFPKTFQIENSVKPELEILGHSDFMIYDSLLLFKASPNSGYALSLFSINNNKHLGDFVNIGRGPLELSNGLADLSNLYFYNNQDRLAAYIYDPYSGKVIDMNLSGSIANSQLQASAVESQFPMNITNFSITDKNLNYLYFKETNTENSMQISRLYFDGTGEKSYEVLDKLNVAKITDSSIEPLNALSSKIFYNTQNSLFIELPFCLNYFNLFKLDNSVSRTICLGEKLTSIPEVEKLDMSERIISLVYSKQFSNFFAVLQINDKVGNYYSGTGKTPEILLFDWDGNPIAKISTNQRFTSFDIDPRNGHLYTFNSKTEEFLKYDVKNILDQLEL